MSSLWSAAASKEGIFARGFLTNKRRKKSEQIKIQKEIEELPQTTSSSRRHFIPLQVPENFNYLESVDVLRDDIRSLLSQPAKFTLADIGGP